MADKDILGKYGEEVTAAYLQKLEYTILHLNYRYLKAEIDIIARKGDILAIVEVKTRTEAYLPDLQQLISVKKRQLMVMAADNYVIKRDLDVEVRFDVVIVLKKVNGYKIEYIDNAFYAF